MSFLDLTDYAQRHNLAFEQIALRRVVLGRPARHCHLRYVYQLTVRGVWELVSCS